MSSTRRASPRIALGGDRPDYRRMNALGLLTPVVKEEEAAEVPSPSPTPAPALNKSPSKKKSSSTSINVHNGVPSSASSSATAAMAAVAEGGGHRGSGSGDQRSPVHPPRWQRQLSAAQDLERQDLQSSRRHVCVRRHRPKAHARAVERQDRTRRVASVVCQHPFGHHRCGDISVDYLGAAQEAPTKRGARRGVCVHRTSAAAGRR